MPLWSFKATGVEVWGWGREREGSGLVRLRANARLNTDVSRGYALSGLTVSPEQQLTLAI